MLFFFNILLLVSTFIQFTTALTLPYSPVPLAELKGEGLNPALTLIAAVPAGDVATDSAGFSITAESEQG
jgi:cytochrome c biogenesis factor